jgi:copper transport protein
MWLRRRVRQLVGLAAAAILAGGIVAAAGTPAYAHANLVATSPPNGAELDRPPAEIRLRFSERVTVAADAVTLRGSGGAAVATGPAALAPDDPSTIVLPVPADLPGGSYIVSFRAVSADSHPVVGAIAFGVGTPAVPVDEADLAAGDPAVSAVFAVARWSSYAGLALLAGGLAVFVLCWPGGWASPRARRLVTVGWVASLAGGVAVLLLQGPYSAVRPLADVADPALLSATLDADFGRYVLVRLVIVVAAAALVFLPRRAPARWQGAGALAVGLALPATWVGTGHANTSDNPLDTVAEVTHLVAMSTWFGGLALLVVCVLPRSSVLPAGEVAPMLRRFSLLATGAVATLVVTGTYVAWRRVGTFEALLGTPYGRLLAFKLAALGVLLWLGAMSRSVVQRRYGVPLPDPDDVEAASRSKRRAVRDSQEQDRSARAQLRQSVRLEAGVAVAILAVASVLVATPPGVVVSAAEALETAPAVPVLDEAPIGEEGFVQVLVDPAWVGENRVVVEVVHLDLEPWDVPEVRASLVLPAGDLGPLPVELARTAEGVYETAAGALIPIAGDWRLMVTVRTSEIDSTTVQIDVPVL